MPAAATPPSHLQPGRRGAELLDHPATPDDLRHAAVPGAARRRQRRLHRAGARDGGRRPGPLLHRRPVLEPRQRLRRRHPPEQLGLKRLRARPPGAVHRARRRHDLRTRVGDRRRPGAAARDRDHRRLGPGRREHVLVRRAGAGQGRLRRADLRPPGAGPVGHVRPVARPERGRAGPDRRPPFYDGTEDAIDFLLSTPQHPYEPVPSCTTGTSHAAKQNARVAAGLDSAYDPFWQLLDRATASGSPATPTAPPASPTSASGIRA